LIFTKDAGPWTKRQWETTPARLDPASQRISGSLPSGNEVYYFNLIDERDLVVSTEHVETEN
jgi:hypothetical protein